MIEAELKFHGDTMKYRDLEITKSMYGWHVLENGEILRGVSDIEDAVQVCVNHYADKGGE